MKYRYMIMILIILAFAGLLGIGCAQAQTTTQATDIDLTFAVDYQRVDSNVTAIQANFTWDPDAFAYRGITVAPVFTRAGHNVVIGNNQTELGKLSIVSAGITPLDGDSVIATIHLTPKDISGEFEIVGTFFIEEFQETPIVVKIVKVIGGTSTEDELPGEMNLAVYPNPANLRFTMNLDVDVPQHVSVTIYDMLGRKVLDVLDQFVNDKTSRVIDVTNALPSGLYILQMIGETFETSQTITVLK